jgi:hypothetical protein
MRWVSFVGLSWSGKNPNPTFISLPTTRDMYHKTETESMERHRNQNPGNPTQEGSVGRFPGDSKKRHVAARGTPSPDPGQQDRSLHEAVSKSMKECLHIGQDVIHGVSGSFVLKRTQLRQVKQKQVTLSNTKCYGLDESPPTTHLGDLVSGVILLLVVTLLCYACKRWSGLCKGLMSFSGNWISSCKSGLL